MRPVINVCLMLAFFLLIPIVPFLLLGEPFERDIQAWLQQQREQTGGMLAAAVVGTLASDIFLPIPSSSVVTYAGGVLGLWPATLWSWLGLTVGSSFGFGLSKLLGKPFARHFAEPADLEKVEAAASRYGPAILLLSRPLPILAEACILLFGTTAMTWRQFVFPVVAANLGIAFAYAACGAGSENQKTLMIATVASGTVPLLIALVIRNRLPTVATDSVKRPQR
jgi:membrane protein DedA with SNARE-associated domain